MLLVKLGGSLITNKDRANCANRQAIRQALRELRRIYRTYEYHMVVGSGAGSFAHRPAHRYRTAEGLVNENSLFGAAVVKERAMAIHLLVYQEALKYGLPFFSLSPSSFLEQGSREFYAAPLLNCLQFGLIPFIYGDVITNNKKGFGIYSTEMSLEIIAKQLLQTGYKNLTLVHLGKTNGVLNANNQTIPLITPANFTQLKECLKGSASIDVTGGMRHKVETSLKLAKRGVKTIIANGLKFRFLKNNTKLQTLIAEQD